jgi:TonB family protein
MTKTEPHGNRAHARRKILPIGYVELGQENGGILLNLSEGGLAVRSPLPLVSREFTGIRFQAPKSQAWLTASGRIVWLSDSKKEGGIQFTELPGDARQQIHKWASADSDLEDGGQSLPASSQGREPSEQILGSPDRNRGENREPTKASNARTQATQTQRELVPKLGQGVDSIKAEPPAQAFRFTDYSMFSAAPENQVVWAVPARRRKGRAGTALLVLLVAALSFALGSTVGRGTLDGWIAYLTSEADNRLAPAPKVTPPAPPEQADTAAPEADEKGSASVPDRDQANAAVGVNPASGPASNSQVAAAPATEKKDELPKGATQPSVSAAAAAVSAADSAARGATARDTAERQTRYSTDNATLRNNREVDAGPGSVAAEHSILVNPPAPGGRPFYVNLPAETISASSAIAISAQRTLQILPSASGRSERVVIGTLKSHSDPFYPVEARKQRIEGSVKLRARIGRTGQILGVTPVSGPDLLTSAAVAAVREWRYEPTFLEGDPVETMADITIVFRLP